MGGKILLEDIRADPAENQAWTTHLQLLLPSHSLVCVKRNRGERDMFQQSTKWEDVEYAVCWTLRGDELARLPRLKAVLLLGAGADQLMPLDALPRDVPVVRLVDQEVARDMGAYALHWVLHFHYGFDGYAKNQISCTWKPFRYPPRSEFVVGVLGLGNVGEAVCKTFLPLGYRVLAWSRSRREHKDVKTFAGPELDTFLSEVNALVNVLPSTPQTEGLLNAERLRLLPEGAVLINMGRGATVDDDALLEALDSGRLRAAVLDTFRKEPLPAHSPYWKHEKVVVTPHVAGCTFARTATKYIADNINRIEAGEKPFPVLDRDLGY